MLHAFGELFEEYRDAERHAELLKEVGFQWRPPDALEFVARFISDRTG
jgi:hypothetical protein